MAPREPWRSPGEVNLCAIGRSADYALDGLLSPPTLPGTGAAAGCRRLAKCDDSIAHSRDSLVVRTSRCGRDNPGSNPGHGMATLF